MVASGCDIWLWCDLLLPRSAALGILLIAWLYRVNGFAKKGEPKSLALASAPDRACSRGRRPLGRLLGCACQDWRQCISFVRPRMVDWDPIAVLKPGRSSGNCRNRMGDCASDPDHGITTKGWGKDARLGGLRNKSQHTHKQLRYRTLKTEDGTVCMRQGLQEPLSSVHPAWWLHANLSLLPRRRIFLYGHQTSSSKVSPSSPALSITFIAPDPVFAFALGTILARFGGLDWNRRSLADSEEHGLSEWMIIGNADGTSHLPSSKNHPHRVRWCVRGD